MAETYDYLQVGTHIKNRLEEKLDGFFLSVRQGRVSMKEEHDKLPEVVIYLEQDAPSETNGISQRVEQTWSVWVVTKADDAGTLISSVIRALSGWTSNRSMFHPLFRTTTQQQPDWSSNGVMYFPLAFSTSFVFTGLES